MQYEGQICRPPMERASFMLPVTVGCSYNQCTFCTLFKHLNFRVLPLAQVEAELGRVRALNGSPKRVFLGDGNACQLPFEHLCEILRLIHQYFPDCTSIGMDATVTDVSKKSGEELKRLRENGLDIVYVGIESGLEDVLLHLKKDHGLRAAYEQTARLKEAGIAYGAHLMLGTAGAGRGLENAEKTAEFINRTGPERIINTTMFIHRRAPLFKEIEDGSFVPALELESLLEERRLMEKISVPIKMYDGFHDVIEVRTRGRLPEDREKMLSHLDEAIRREKANPKREAVFFD